MHAYLHSVAYDERHATEENKSCYATNKEKGYVYKCFLLAKMFSHACMYVYIQCNAINFQTHVKIFELKTEF